jgi:hypothetical protein
MNWIKTLAIAASLGLLVTHAGAQDAKPGDEPATSATRDRGDAKAEKLLKRAYVRVHSAESEGLKRMHATADIDVDANNFGLGNLSFPGDLWWKTGSKAMWVSADDGGEEGNRNPLGSVSDRARQLFEPYLAYVAGFEAWDMRFKEASFKLLEPKEDKELGKIEQVEVTYGDKTVEVFAVNNNKMLSFAKDAEIKSGDLSLKAKVTFRFEYEDLGAKLRPSKVTGETDLEMPEMPGDQDPKNPGKPRIRATDRLTAIINVEKWGKAGDFDVALELKGAISLKSLGEFPVTLKLSSFKINDEVKDEDFPKPAGEGEENGEKKDGDKKEEKDDEEF